MMGGIFAETGEDGDKHFQLLVISGDELWGLVCAGTALESADRSRQQWKRSLSDIS